LNTSLAGLLDEEIRCLREFCIAIAEEQSVLVAGQVDKLPDAAEKKAGLASKLNALDAKRNDLLIASGFEPGQRGMDAWRQTQPESEALWSSVLELAIKAKTENEINGRLIGSRLQHNQQALSILLGDDGNTVTYGPNGQQAGIVGRRPLGQA
jgi:flagella synthesis protein FlgN